MSTHQEWAVWKRNFKIYLHKKNDIYVSKENKRHLGKNI